MKIHTWTMPPELLAFVGGQIGILRRGPSALGQVVPRCLDGAIVLFGREFNTIPLLRENRNSSSNIFSLLTHLLAFKETITTNFKTIHWYEIQ